MLKVMQKKAVRILILALFLSTFFVLPTFADDVDYSVSVTDSLKLTIPKTSINLNLDPSIKPFDSEDLTVIVGTNSAVGYQLIMSSDTTNLVKTNDDTKTIPTLDPLDGGYTLDNFTVNKWGYKVGAGNYVPFVSGDTIVNKDVIANNDTNVINFATKIDFLQPAGEYNMTLTFTAVAHLLVTYMQDFDLDMCTESPQEIIDLRDGETYLVQKLADGNCWMLDNLRLDPTEVSLDDLKGNTNATSISLTHFKKGSGETPYALNGVYSNQPVGSADSDTMNPEVFTEHKNDVVSNHGAGSGKIGVYYDYCSASAGSYCYRLSEGTGDAKYDICPFGWRLPTGGPGGEYDNLYAAYNSSAANTVNALDIIASGFVNYDGTIQSQNSSGYYWSSTNKNAGRMYDLNMLSATFINTTSDDSRNYAQSVRCLLKPKSTITFHTSNAAGIKLNDKVYTDGQSAKIPHGVYRVEGIYDSRQAFQSWSASTGTITNANYVDYNLNTYEVTQDAAITLTGRTTNLALQDVTDATCSTTPTPAYDNRDGQTYWIKKLDDGRCWMMDNLNLGAITLTTDLTSANTNVADTVSADTFNSWKKEESTYDSELAEYIPVTTANSEDSEDVDKTSGTKYGTLYNYCAITAGTYCFDRYSTVPGDATYDICPAGWKMPTGGASGELHAIYENSSYDTYAELRAPVSEGGAAFAFSGFTNGGGGGPRGQNSIGRFWSSTNHAPYTNMYIIGLYSSGAVNNPTYNARYDGLALRCILK